MLRQIRDYFKALQLEIPDVKHFVFSNDEKALRDVISGFRDFYMFVDYGEFDSMRDDKNRIRDGFDVAVTVAYPIGVAQKTLEEVTEYQLYSFELCAIMRGKMLARQNAHPWLQFLSEEHSILPFVAPNLSRSIGHTFAFKVKGYDLLNVKKYLP